MISNASDINNMNNTGYTNYKTPTKQNGQNGREENKNGRLGYSVIDRSPKKKEIVQDLIKGMSFTKIGEKYGIAKTTVKNWYKEQLRKSLEEDRESVDFSALDRMLNLEGQASKLLNALLKVLYDPDNPEELKPELDPKVLKNVVPLMSVLRAILKDIAEIRGELKTIQVNQVNQVNIDVTNVLIPNIVQAIWSATKDCPEVAVRISDAIDDLMKREVVNA